MENTNKTKEIKTFQVIKWTKYKNFLSFDRLGDNFVNYKNTKKSLRPIIVFFGNEDSYYYLKVRNQNNIAKNNQVRNILETEYALEKIEGSNLPENDVYIDCSQIFKIKKEALIDIIDTDCDDYINSKQMNIYDIINVLEKTYFFLNQFPPQVSITNVIFNVNTKQTFPKTIYSNDQLMQKDYNKSQNENKEIRASVINLKNQYTHITEINRLKEELAKIIIELKKVL